MPLVERLVFFYRDFFYTRRFHGNRQRINRAFQNGGKRFVKTELLQLLARFARFVLPLFRQGYICPPGESVFQVPLRFTVSKQYEFSHTGFMLVNLTRYSLHAFRSEKYSEWPVIQNHSRCVSRRHVTAGISDRNSSCSVRPACLNIRPIL